MSRTIIQIDEEKCVGCGLCANTCHQSALAIVDGKAKVVRADACDGLGRCLPVCPMDAIHFVEVEEEQAQLDATPAPIKPPALKLNPVTPPSGGCPGNRVMTMGKQEAPADLATGKMPSALSQWPVQIKLVPVQAPYFNGANLLVAADCTAFAYGDFHREFIRNRVTLIGCPKLDEGDYTEKLSRIIAENEIKSLTVVRMEVPCCGGIERAAVTALRNSGKWIPWQVVTISLDGKILD